MADQSSSFGNLGDALRGKGVDLSFGKKTNNEGPTSRVGTTKVVPRFQFKGVKIPKVQVSFQSKAEREAALAEFKEFSASAAEAMHDMMANLRAIQMMPEEEAVIYAADFQALQGAIQEMLGYNQPAAREVAVIAYADALIRTCPDYRNWVRSTLEDLVRIGFLIQLPSLSAKGSKSNSADLRIYGENYNLHPSYAKNPQAHKVLEALLNLLDRTQSAEQERFGARLAELKTEVGPSSLTVTELKEGKTGKALLAVPNPKVESKVDWLLINSDGQKIVALGAAGSIETKVSQLIEMGVYVPVKQIGASQIQLAERVEKEFYRDVLILDFMLTRAIALVEKKARIVEIQTKSGAERQELAGQATVTEVEFYLDSKPGVVFYDFGPETFKMKILVDGKVTGMKPFNQVFALIERNDQHQIRVLSCPERLNELFAGHHEFVAEGEKFSGLGVLCALLRIGWSKTKSELSDKEKKARQEAWEKTRAEKKVANEIAARSEAIQLAVGTGEDVSGISLPEPESEEQERPKTKKTKKAAAKKAKARS